MPTRFTAWYERTPSPVNTLERGTLNLACYSDWLIELGEAVAAVPGSSLSPEGLPVG